LCTACLCLISQTVDAEIKYVTDDLNLALHEQEGSKGKLLERLQSGTKLEVLEESGLFAKVRTPEGTVGWTKAGFLMSDKPARARVLELEQEQAALKLELEKTRKQLASSSQLASELRAEKIQTALELAGHKENKQGYEGLIEKLTEERAELQERVDDLEDAMPTEWSTPLSWSFAIAGISLLLGLLGGIGLFDWLSRRRHGGYRIY
jgi:SH3 domain protein